MWSFDVNVRRQELLPTDDMMTVLRWYVAQLKRAEGRRWQNQTDQNVGRERSYWARAPFHWASTR